MVCTRFLPLFHACHVTVIGLSLLIVSLYLLCPLCHDTQCIQVPSDSMSPPIPTSSVCQCLDGLFSSFRGSLSSVTHMKYLTLSTPYSKRYRSTFLLHLMLLLCGDVEQNPGPSASTTSVTFSCLNVRSASSVTDSLNKPCILQEFISDNSVEVISLTETWLFSDTPVSTQVAHR